MREYIRKNKLTIYVFFVGVLCLITGGALAFFNASFRGVKEQTLNIGEDLTFTYNETGSALALDNNDIMSNDKGKAKTSYFDFNIKLKADAKKTVKYNIYLTKSTTSTLDNSKLKIYLTDQSNNVIKDVTSVQNLQIFSKYANSYLLYQKEITSTNNTEVTDYYRLRVWLDDSLGTSITENNGVHTIEEPNFSYKFTVNVDVGDNDSKTMLTSLILGDNNSNVLSSSATLTSDYASAGDASGLYKSIAGETDSGTTYFYRGAVTNNYVSFANMLWRIVRINEDGTIRLVLQDGINNNTSYQFSFTNSGNGDLAQTYYSNTDTESSDGLGAKKMLDNWYQSNLKDYDTMISNSKFCESYKAITTTGHLTGDANPVLMTNYVANFNCPTDGNGKGVVTSKIGLLNYDEVIHAGTYPNTQNVNIYLDNNQVFWLMTGDGYDGDGPYVFVLANISALNAKGYIYSAWPVMGNGNFDLYGVTLIITFRPVISLNADTMVTGSGTESDPYVVK